MCTCHALREAKPKNLHETQLASLLGPTKEILRSFLAQNDMGSTLFTDEPTSLNPQPKQKWSRLIKPAPVGLG